MFQPPDKSYWNGVLKGYYVGYKEAGEVNTLKFKEISSKGLEMEEGKYVFLISGLKRKTQYEVVMQAYNSAGSGPKSTPDFAETLAEGFGLCKCFDPCKNTKR